jgi:hypothetical protein
MMDCCSEKKEYKGEENKPNWIQMVAIGMVLLLVLGFVLGR